MSQIKVGLITAAGVIVGYAMLNMSALVVDGGLSVDLPEITADSPRGIRNSNPGNIEYEEDNKWRGQIGSDGRFSIFDSPVNGIRAMARLINNYRDTYGINTIYGVISRWAPGAENNTTAYIASVSRYTGIDPLADIGDKLDLLIAAIINHENGQQPYSQNLIDTAIQAA